jgi:hypothetical protein
MVLLTSVFVPPPGESFNQHIEEVVAAVNTNFRSEFLVEVHILTENDCYEIVRLLKQSAERMPDSQEIMRKMDEKLTCKSTGDRKQPSYADFFRYANETLLNRVVLFSNADVVFDETLGLIDLAAVRRQEYGYVLSVRSPPHGGEYLRVFHRECDNTNRCAVGSWQGGGSWGQKYGGCSWDSYIFAPPLSSKMDLPHVNIIMNLNAAEYLAGYQLEVRANLSLYNPCYHVHAWHWHCLGGKMHSRSIYDRADRPLWYTQHFHLPPNREPDAVVDVLPCWNCPGIRMPRGAVGAGKHCQNGSEKGPKEVTALKHNFRYPHVNGGICCKSSETCWKLPVEQLPHCQQADDVDCVTWESTNEHSYH